MGRHGHHILTVGSNHPRTLLPGSVQCELPISTMDASEPGDLPRALRCSLDRRSERNLGQISCSFQADQFDGSSDRCGSRCDNSYCSRHCLWRILRWRGVDNVNSLAVFCLRSEEHTSELQSRLHLVCRLLLEKKKHN